jgi:hypothetical protein
LIVEPLSALPETCGLLLFAGEAGETARALGAAGGFESSW